MEVFWPRATIAQEEAVAVVSWPAARKVMSWSTRFSAEKTPEERATDMMSEPMNSVFSEA